LKAISLSPVANTKNLIVVGNGMVGHHCVEQLIARGALDRYQLHVFSEEPMRAYDRVHLSEYFTGRDAESLALSDAALYHTPGVTCTWGCRCWRSTASVAR
jgi:nitrite reductase (NADH) large subunit